MINTLPQNPAPQPSGLAASLSSVAGGALSTQQITAAAVPGTGAPSAYFSQTQQRDSTAPVRTNAQPDRAAILPDPDFWKVPTREAAMQAPLPARTPNQINLPQVSQFTAQVIAQQPPQAAVQAQASQAEPVAEEVPMLRKTSTTQPGKKANVSDARGTDAYAVATQRLSTISFPPTVEAVS